MSFQEMEKTVEMGLARAIGVSNFSVRQLRKLNAVAKIPPSVNQVRSVSVVNIWTGRTSIFQEDVLRYSWF